MIRRRGLIPILLLVLVLFGVVAQIVGGRTAAPGAPVATPQASVAATPTPTPSAGPARAVVRSLAAVQQAFNAGDVRLLCRSGALVDPAVIRLQNAESGGCESQLETLMASELPLRLAVRQVALRRDLATAAVATASGGSVPVDLVRQGRRWLLSFSGGGDPMLALAGAA
jgi:hypothetical protein